MQACWRILWRPVSSADIAALADADARENWTFMVDFRDRLISAPSLEACIRRWPARAPATAADLSVPLCHLILRNALEGCDDPYTLRAGELFYRSQLAAIQDGACCWPMRKSSRRSNTPNTTCIRRR